MSSTPRTPFDFGTRLGLVFIVEAAFLSALAVTSVLLYIGVCDLFHVTASSLDILGYTLVQCGKNQTWGFPKMVDTDAYSLVFPESHDF